MLVTTPWSDIIAFSPYRWSTTLTRPQQLMEKFAKHRRVFFIEEPLVQAFEIPFLKAAQKTQNLIVATPCLPQGLSDSQQADETERLIAEWLRQEEVVDYTSWYFDPSALRYSRELEPEVVVYHRLACFEVNEELQNEMLEAARLVFTDLSLRDAHDDDQYLIQEQKARESLRIPALALLSARKRGTLVARLS